MLRLIAHLLNHRRACDYCPLMSKPAIHVYVAVVAPQGVLAESQFGLVLS
jgi:hypothetical protein